MSEEREIWVLRRRAGGNWTWERLGSRMQALENAPCEFLTREECERSAAEAGYRGPHRDFTIVKHDVAPLVEHPGVLTAV
jgi:hypothetical protein